MFPDLFVVDVKLLLFGRRQTMSEGLDEGHWQANWNQQIDTGLSRGQERVGLGVGEASSYVRDTRLQSIDTGLRMRMECPQGDREGTGSLKR